jgi:hypothetical protein
MLVLIQQPANGIELREMEIVKTQVKTNQISI